MSDLNKINQQRQQRQRRVRAKIFGDGKRPRLTVLRSNKHLSVQVVNDETGKTLAAANDVAEAIKGTKTEKAVQVAKNLLVVLKSKKIKALVFDRAYYKYHGRIKALAETLREGGIKL